MEYTKFPKIPHLPWSESIDEDDILADLSFLKTCNHIVVTEKLDGENTTMYKDLIHARSVDSRNHISRDWVKALWGKIRYMLSDSLRLCGENVYATHSIHYDSLESYFYLFMVFFIDHCLSWRMTKEWAEALSLEVVPVLYEGPWDEEKIRACFTGISKFGPNQEGYVVRNADSFLMDDFQQNVAKFVRKNHVQTDEHWMNKKVVPNGIILDTTK